MNERDTHFAHAAHLLFNELYERGLIARPDIRVYRDNFDGAAKFQNEVRQHGEQIIAQFAYDLMYHLLKTADTSTFAGIYGHYDGPPDEVVRELISRLPDLTAWPNTSPEAP